MRRKKSSPWLKVVVAVLLLLCLMDMPYGFYTLVRFLAAAAFIYLSYEAFKSKKNGQGIAFAALAVLFQPIIKISLGRAIWNIIDVLVAVALIYLLIKALKKR